MLKIFGPKFGPAALKNQKAPDWGSNDSPFVDHVPLKKLEKAGEINDFTRFFLVRVVGLKPTSLAVPNRAFYQLNYTRIFDFSV